jgi:hypothetical protein
MEIVERKLRAMKTKVKVQEDKNNSSLNTPSSKN